MTKVYTPAIFQPTVRPSWAGMLSYIPNEEKSQILEAIIKYPNETNIQSKFWEETAKPDLDSQYQKFVQTCESRGKGARTYWGEHKLSISSTYDIDKDNLLKDKDKEKDKDKVKGNIIKTLNNFSNNKILISDSFNLLEMNDPDIPLYKNEYGNKIILDVQDWLVKRYKGKMVGKEYIIRQIKNFAYRQGVTDGN